MRIWQCQNKSAEEKEEKNAEASLFFHSESCGVTQHYDQSCKTADPVQHVKTIAMRGALRIQIRERGCSVREEGSHVNVPLHSPAYDIKLNPWHLRESGRAPPTLNETAMVFDDSKQQEAPCRFTDLLLLILNALFHGPESARPPLQLTDLVVLVFNLTVIAIICLSYLNTFLRHFMK